MDKEGVTIGQEMREREREMSVMGEGDENVLQEQRDREERGRQSGIIECKLN